MPDSEFDIIARYFVRQRPARGDVLLGIGDDAALLQVPAGQQLVVAVDTLVTAPLSRPNIGSGHRLQGTGCESE